MSASGVLMQRRLRRHISGRAQLVFPDGRWPDPRPAVIPVVNSGDWSQYPMRNLVVLDFDGVGVLKTSLSKEQEDKLRAALSNVAKA